MKTILNGRTVAGSSLDVNPPMHSKAPRGHHEAPLNNSWNYPMTYFSRIVLARLAVFLDVHPHGPHLLLREEQLTGALTGHEGDLLQRGGTLGQCGGQRGGWLMPQLMQ